MSCWNNQSIIVTKSHLHMIRCPYVIHYVHRKFKKGRGGEKEEKITAFLTREGHITSPYLYFACSFTSSSHRHQQLLSFGTSAHWHDKQWQYGNCCCLRYHYRALLNGNFRLTSFFHEHFAIHRGCCCCHCIVISFFATFCLHFANNRMSSTIFKIVS